MHDPDQSAAQINIVDANKLAIRWKYASGLLASSFRLPPWPPDKLVWRPSYLLSGMSIQSATATCYLKYFQKLCSILVLESWFWILITSGISTIDPEMNAAETSLSTKVAKLNGRFLRRSFVKSAPLTLPWHCHGTQPQASGVPRKETIIHNTNSIPVQSWNDGMQKPQKLQSMLLLKAEPTSMSLMPTNWPAGKNMPQDCLLQVLGFLPDPR